MSLRHDLLSVQKRLAFTQFSGGGGVNANSHNSALQSATGNGQMMTAHDNRIYVGNPQTPLAIESSDNPTVVTRNGSYTMYHTGNLSLGNYVGGSNSTGTTT